MSIRDYELCSGRCPAERPCPPEASGQYRRLWDFSQGTAAAVQPLSGGCPPPIQAPVKAPGFRQRVRNFSAAYLKWVDAGKPLTPPDEAARRLEICRTCEQHDAEKNVCLLCGCPLQEVGLLVSLVSDAPGKLAMATEGCPYRDTDGNPAPKWLPVVGDG